MARGGGGLRSPPRSRGGGDCRAASPRVVDGEAPVGPGFSLRRSKRFVRWPSPKHCNVPLQKLCESPAQAGLSAVSVNIPLHPAQAAAVRRGREAFEAALAKLAVWQPPRFSTPGNLLEEGEISAGVVDTSLCGAGIGVSTDDVCESGDCLAAQASGKGCGDYLCADGGDLMLVASPLTPPSAHQPMPGSWTAAAESVSCGSSSCMPTICQNALSCSPMQAGPTAPPLTLGQVQEHICLVEVRPAPLPSPGCEGTVLRQITEVLPARNDDI